MPKKSIVFNGSTAFSSSFVRDRHLFLSSLPVLLPYPHPAGGPELQKLFLDFSSGNPYNDCVLNG